MTLPLIYRRRKLQQHWGPQGNAGLSWDNCGCYADASSSFSSSYCGCCCPSSFRRPQTTSKHPPSKQTEDDKRDVAVWGSVWGRLRWQHTTGRPVGRFSTIQKQLLTAACTWWAVRVWFSEYSAKMQTLTPTFPLHCWLHLNFTTNLGEKMNKMCI